MKHVHATPNVSITMWNHWRLSHSQREAKGHVREASSRNFRLLVIAERLVRTSSLFLVLLLKTGSATTPNKNKSCKLHSSVYVNHGPKKDV